MTLTAAAPARAQPESMIPAIIHQTWKDRSVPDRFRAAQASWQAAHPEWEYRLWTDADLDDVVSTYAPELVPLYRSYPYQIQRVDAARYVILRQFGGAYADLDLVCMKPLDGLRAHRVVLPLTTPWGVSNQFMLSQPGQSLFDYAIRSLPDAYRRWQRWWFPRHLRVLRTTGPLFLTARLKEHGPVEGLRILSLDEHCHGDPELAYVHNLRGKTWAEWDTHALNFLHDYWRPLTALGVGAAAAGWYLLR